MHRNFSFCFSSFVLFLLHSASCRNNTNINGVNYNLDDHIVDILKKKLGNIHNIGQNNANDSFNKKLELLKKQIEKIQKYETQYAGKGYDDIYDNELEGFTKKKKKKNFGMDEEDLDNDDENFLGQGKTINKDENEGKEDGDEENEVHGKAVEESGEKDEDDYDDDETADDPESQRIEGNEENQAGETSGGTQVTLEEARQGERNVSGDGVQLAHTHTPVTSNNTLQTPQSGGSLPREGNVPSGETTVRSAEAKEQEAQVPTDAAARSNAQSQLNLRTSAPNGDTTAQPQQNRVASSGDGGQVAVQQVNMKPPKVMYLDKLYDDILSETNKKKEIEVHIYHRKYNALKKQYEFSMDENEYNMVKKLFNECFKEGEGNNSSATNFTNVFKKVLEDNVFHEKFDNVIHGIYGFAKRHSYLSSERINNNDAYKVLFNNALSLINTM
ncbi:MSP7-like protein, putative [Plasmodium malariae]|uniref:MSP7-like protein, putative n=1 Tax=Plasmodium malariae TaxID=5858 RepID=A0A1D3SQC3_PLAMA|nr:MSP7-like protein, putative [Plasmodium malariae]SCO93707.1 MSP7-like protein, putative [Plasmodium malariae]